MIWSYSTSQMFQRCQRQWYFKTCIAHHSARDPIRKEAYLLSKLQSIPAWRGSIVDEVISRRVVPAINQGWLISKAKIFDYARNLFDGQLEFAQQHRLREDGIRPSQIGDHFAAFYDVEYGTLQEEDIAQAWTDIELALTNLFQMSELIGILKSAHHLAAQRAIAYPFFNMTVRAVPDLIVFYEDKAPLIIDWKVSTAGRRDYRTQLAIYASALLRCKPHKDFPTTLLRYDASAVRLLEVQLLLGQCREYELSSTDVENTESFIAKSMEQMSLAKGSDKNRILRPFDFEVTDYPEYCLKCPFRKICWEDSLWQN